MATEKQIAANRRNAQGSTGPRTYEGKRMAARNSFKHGLLARPALLPDEDEKAFREFVEERIRELDPVGALESELAEQIVGQMWRLRRFQRLEAGLFIRDRAERDVEYFRSREARFERSEPSPHMETMLSFQKSLYGSGPVEITDEARHAEAVEKRSAAEEGQRSELALLGDAFASAAVNGDLFGKLTRYETAALNRLRHLMADFVELQAQRDGMHGGEAVETTPAS